MHFKCDGQRGHFRAEIGSIAIGTAKRTLKEHSDSDSPFQWGDLPLERWPESVQRATGRAGGELPIDSFEPN